MAKISFTIGDEVAITATLLGRITEDRVGVSIPRYEQPYSIVDRTSIVTVAQPIELVGDVTYVDNDAGKVTVNLGIPVTLTLTRYGS